MTRTKDNVEEHKRSKHSQDMKNKETNSENVGYMHTCISCDFNTNEYNCLRDHIDQTHKPTQDQEEMPEIGSNVDAGRDFNKSLEQENNGVETAVSCGVCGNIYDSELDCSKHMESHPSKCYKCDFWSEDTNELNTHERKEHVHHVEDEFISPQQGSQEVSPKTSCDQCDYKAKSVTELVDHILRTHKNNVEVTQCPYCEFKSIDMEGYKDHLEADHVELAMFGHIASNQLALTENFETFKNELTNILNVIINDHNIMKQESFISRQNNHDQGKKLNDIEEALANVSNLVSAGYPKKTESENTGASTNKPSVPMPKAAPIPKAAPVRARACFIGDSMISNLDLKVVENAMQSEVRIAKAYSSLDNPKEDDAKEKTRFPEKNFSVVIDAEMKKADTDILVIQAGSVDISNMKIGEDNLKKYGEYFKQETIISATNLFTYVTNALVSNPGLKKAIILKQTPQYDPKTKDPHSVKSALSQLYNDTLVQLWLGSIHKSRITLGSHNLDCAGGVREARYRSKNKYDGLHLDGPSGGKAYTESVLSILREGDLVKSPPPNYFHKYHKETEKRFTSTKDTDIRQKQNFSVPTSNRFNPLNC